MTYCEFCLADLGNLREHNIQILDSNGFVAATYSGCDPCTSGIIEVLQAFKNFPGSLKQVIDEDEVA